MNQAIRAPELRVIDQDGKQLGILSRDEALREAANRELDLVEISPSAKPPVVKIVDWGKYNYERTKQQKKNRQSAKTQEIKQMRFGMKISGNDLEVKLNKVRHFLADGNKVKISIFFRGRENAHKDLGFKMADELVENLGESIVVDQAPQLAGRQLTFVVRPNGKPADKAN